MRGAQSHCTKSKTQRADDNSESTLTAEPVSMTRASHRASSLSVQRKARLVTGREHVRERTKGLPAPTLLGHGERFGEAGGVRGLEEVVVLGSGGEARLLDLTADLQLASRQ